MSDYKDIDFLLTQNALTNDMNVKLDSNAVSQSIKNIILTGKGEKLFSPQFGGNAYDMLFDSISPLDIENKKILFKSNLAIYEKRATIININITDTGLGYLLIDVEYYLNSTPHEKRFVKIET